jgi:hypothetical protein
MAFAGHNEVAPGVVSRERVDCADRERRRDKRRLDHGRRPLGVCLLDHRRDAADVCGCNGGGLLEVRVRALHDAVWQRFGCAHQTGRADVGPQDPVPEPELDVRDGAAVCVAGRHGEQRVVIEMCLRMVLKDRLGRYLVGLNVNRRVMVLGM